MMAEGGSRNCSKKSDDICGDACGEVKISSFSPPLFCCFFAYKKCGFFCLNPLPLFPFHFLNVLFQFRLGGDCGLLFDFVFLFCFFLNRIIGEKSMERFWILLNYFWE